jgi:hypothetical protein
VPKHALQIAGACLRHNRYAREKLHHSFANASTFAAEAKSFSDKPPTECVL